MSIVGLVAATTLQLIANWAACTFLYGPRLLSIQVESQGKIALGQACDGAGDKAVSGMSALLATLLGLASQPPSKD